MKNRNYILGILLIILLGSFQAQASHIKSGYLSYTCLGNNQYEVTMRLYVACGGVNAPNNVNIRLDGLGSCAGIANNYTLPMISNAPYTVACSNNSILCDPNNPSSASTDYTENIYRATITIPSTYNGCGWHLSYSTCCRIGSLTNIISPGSQGFYTETTLIDSSGICNTSPVPASHPVTAVCAGSPIALSNLLFDTDGDSLVYALASPLSSNASPISFSSGLSPSQPFVSTGGTSINLDSNTGMLTFNATANQTVDFDIMVSEYRNGVLIGVSRRPIQMMVLANCTSSPAVLDSVARQVNGAWVNQGMSTTFDVCPGEPLSFELYFSDVDISDSLSLDSISSSIYQVYPNAVIQQYYTGSNYNQLTLNVAIPFSTLSSTTVAITDHNCPLLNIQMYGIYFVERAGCGRLSGYIFADTSGNCMVDPGEDTLGNYLISIGNSGFSMTVSTDQNGYYDVPLSPGLYAISLASIHPYRELCFSAQGISMPVSNLQHDLPIQETASCVYMQVDIGAPIMLRCFDNYYVVNYCNYGTATAAPASVDVTLSPLFVVDSTSLPVNSQTGLTYNFNLGTLPPDSCGQFYIYGRLDTACTSPLGAAICATAHIYPDTTCGIWSGAELIVEGRCQNDSVGFRIRNVGQQAMGSPTSYTVVEDNMILHTGSNINLGAGASTSWINYSATGSTYRLVIEQDATYPWSKTASSTVEGCTNSNSSNQSFITGLVNSFSLNDGAPYTSTDCQPSVGSYDPNDKQAFPVGYGSTNAIEPNVDLEYRVRFQNTGTAPAIDVVILDTLSDYLDLTTLQLSSASHAYTWRLRENNVLEVTFANIMLPDSASAPLASQGFIDFRIKQKFNNPLGTVINNTAAIYFDRNAPIITNTVFHTIDENFIQFVGLPDGQQGAALTVKAFPNPFKETTTLQVQGAVAYEHLTLTVYNALGQVVAQVHNQGGAQEIVLQRQGLHSGLYFYQLEGDDQLLHTGQLIAR